MSTKITWADGSTQTLSKDSASIQVSEAGVVAVSFGDRTLYISPSAYKQISVDQS